MDQPLFHKGHQLAGNISPMSKFLQGSALATFVTLTPLLAMAQYFGEVDTFFINIGGFVNNILVPLIFTLSLAAFIYGMFKYFILNGDNDGEREKGRQLAVWGVAGFVLMVSIWAIVNLLAGGLTQGMNNTVPTLPGTPTR